MSFLKEYKHQREIVSYKEYLYKHMDDIDLIEAKMSELYKHMKHIAPSYADKERYVDNSYSYFVLLLSQIEKMLPYHFILENKPNFDFTRNYDRITSDDIKDKSEKEIIEYIVHRGRCYIAAYFCKNKDEAKVDLGKLNLECNCNISSGNVKLICDSLKLFSENIVIFPAFYDEINVYDYGNKHMLTIVTIGKKQYIVDLTYSQFFLLRYNNFDRLGIPLLGGCAAGLYMSLTDEQREFAERLMRDGYVEATEENIKLYYDGFAMSFRNGLYYENMKKITYETSYTASDYHNFIAGRDNQIRHEDFDCLGRQKKVLKNPDMSFRLEGYKKIS
ncbi:MAG: hypothetical protein K2L98_03385 [Bacilli bacterium]|nr:hypothetical protein [Bacilli bacterium]